MNYCQIDIKGQKVGLKFGNYASQLFMEEIAAGRKLMIGDTLNDLGIAHVLWFGYLNNCERRKIDPVLSFEDFYDKVDESMDNPDEVKAAMDCWSRSQVVQKAVEESKKKSSGTI